MIPKNVERYLDHAGKHRWRYLADNHVDILADSGEGYENEQDMEDSLTSIFKTLPSDTEAVDAALAILTLVTGDEWDRAKLLAQAGTLRDLAIHTLKRQGLTSKDAETFVDERWKNYASDLPQEPDVVAPGTPEVSGTTSTEIGINQIPTVEDLMDRLAERNAKKKENPDD